MSGEDNNIGGECCASCGKAEVNDIKLRDCDKCDLARYCGDECQQGHRQTHAEICKERAAELRDEILFRQPEETHLGDCPICCLPLPIDLKKSAMYPCCSKMICKGCSHANRIREKEQRLKRKCPFCRKPFAKTNEEAKKMLIKRADANDPHALVKIGATHNLEGDYDKALEYFTKAAELGNAEAHFSLSVMYYEGRGVEKNEERWIYHLEEAAIGGHPGARHTLALSEGRNGRMDTTVKHFMIAANLGHNESLQALKEGYKVGAISKDDLAAALRAHHAATSAMKSPQREEAAKYEE